MFNVSGVSDHQQQWTAASWFFLFHFLSVPFVSHLRSWASQCIFPWTHKLGMLPALGFKKQTAFDCWLWQIRWVISSTGHGFHLTELSHSMCRLSQSMITCLDDAVHLSSDPPDTLPIQTSFLHHTSNPGWPSLQIPPEILAAALGLHGTTHLAQIFDCSAWTICHQVLDYGLAEPGLPVYVKYDHDDGLTYWFYTSSTGATADMLDDELDMITSQIVNTFPNFGHCMINGHLKHLGHCIPLSWVQVSYAQVHGAQVGLVEHEKLRLREIMRNCLLHPLATCSTLTLITYRTFHNYVCYT